MQSRLRSAAHVRLAVFLALVAFVTVPLAPRASAQQSDKLGDIRKKQTENTYRDRQPPRKSCRASRASASELQISIQQLAGQLAEANDRLAQAQADSDRYAVDTYLTSISIDKTQKRSSRKRRRQRAAARCSCTTVRTAARCST